MNKSFDIVGKLRIILRKFEYFKPLSGGGVRAYQCKCSAIGEKSWAQRTEGATVFDFKPKFVEDPWYFVAKHRTHTRTPDIPTIAR